MIEITLICILLALMGGAELVIAALRLVWALAMALLSIAFVAAVWGLWYLHHQGVV